MKLKGKEVFELLLHELCIAQIATNPPQICGTHRTETETFNALPNTDEQLVDRVLFSKKCVFTPASILVKEKRAEALLRQRSQEFLPFVNKHKNDVTLSHAYYVEFLLRWFPGKVHVRQLR